MLKFLNTHRNKLYWILQSAGWGGYALLYTLVSFSLQSKESNPLKFTIYLVAGIMGFLLTHLFRKVIKKEKWVQLPFFKIAYRVILSSILLGGTLFASIFIYVIKMNLLDKGDQFTFGVAIAITANYTILVLLWSTIYFAVHYFEKFQRSEIERFIWEAAVKDFELKTLKSQLNPHFMFNALNGIRALIEEDPERAKTAITQLSCILRYSLMIERVETVALEDEIKTVNDYLSLEQVRFEERLSFSIQISPSAAKIEIPPMMIQTLVENGIKHGISKIPKGGELIINAKVLNNQLIVNIKNSGELDEVSLKNSKGFGVSNTKQRLSIIYGDTASFKLFNNNHFVVAELIIPLGGVENESINSR